MLSKWSGQFSLVVVGIALAGCDNLASSTNSKVATELVKIFWPAKDISGSEDGWADDMDAGNEGILGSGKWENRFYINFAGAKLSKDDSFIIARAGHAQIDIPAFSATDLGSGYQSSETRGLRDEIVTKLKATFADINVSLLTEKPKEPYSTVYIGGENFTTTSDVLGVAPLDLSNFSGADRIFVFSRAYQSSAGSDSLSTLVNVAAHEISHSLGARHISAEQAVLNPIVRADSNDLDVSAVVVGEEERENTRELLLRTVGPATNTGNTGELPEIVDLAMSSDGDVGQLSVFSAANFAANADLALNDFNYKWSFEGKTAMGPTVRILFEGGVGSVFEVVLEISNTEGMSQTHKFEVNKNPA